MTSATLSAMAKMIFEDFREPAASQACDIAMNFLVQTREVYDPFEAVVFLAQYIGGMVDQGHKNKILMANRAISAYQASLGQPDEQLSPPEAAQPQSMEQLLGNGLRW